jgi:hypothetical protein
MAQTVTRTFDDLRAESHHGETVYVTDLAGATTKGRVLRISANSIALIVKNQTREWPVSEVTWITQRRGSAGRGALIGLAVGAVIGPLLVALDSGGDDYVLFFAPFSAGLGGGIGAAIGAARRPELSCTLWAVVRPLFRWRLVWRRALLSGARKSASEWSPWGRHNRVQRTWTTPISSRVSRNTAPSARRPARNWSGWPPTARCTTPHAVNR